MLDECILQLTQPRVTWSHRRGPSRLRVLLRRVQFLLQPLTRPLRARLAARVPDPAVTAYALALCQVRWQVEWEARLAKELAAIRIEKGEPPDPTEAA
jgi:hypothetical protein